MNIDYVQLQHLVNSPSERLAVELKRWLDPETPEGREKITIGCLALYNNNGGYMAFGFDKNGNPVDDGLPANVRATFNPDKIQGIIVKESHIPFEVAVEFVARGVQEYPVLCIPSGVTTPAVTRRRFRNVAEDTVYVRSIVNGCVSSSKARREDWDRLIRLCMENREADLGYFFQRHLGVKVDVDKVREGFSMPVPLHKTAMSLLDEGRQRFQQVNKGNTLPNCGYVEISVIISGPRGVEFQADRNFLHAIDFHRVDQSGWPPFVHIHNPREPQWNPYVYEEGWEANIVAGAMGMKVSSIDFWRMEPEGRFYTIRALQDDMIDERLEPLKWLDPILLIKRLDEVFATGLSFVEALEYELDRTEVAFAFRWSGLTGRHLSTWANPGYLIRGAHSCRQDVVSDTVLLPATTSNAALWQYVSTVARKLLRCFGGYDSLGDEDIRRILGR